MSVDTKRAPLAPSPGLPAFTRLFLGVGIPIAYCTILLYAKFAALFEQARTFNGEFRAWLEITHLLLSITFVALLGCLFVIRKHIIGPNASLGGAIVAVLGSIFPFFLVVGEARDISTGLLAGSLLILVIGEVLTVWSLASLGRCFGVFPVARGLVTGGPYAWVRHPLYTAEAIVTFGFLLTRITPLTLAIFGAGLALQIWRTINEERALLHVFPEYAAYRQRTGRFLPRWR